MEKHQQITVLGAGITGLWQALLFARGGYDVTLIEKSPKPFADSASLYAGAMIAPHCETENGDPLIEKLGIQALNTWKTHFPDFQQQGSIVLAKPREKNTLKHFARKTSTHKTINADQLAELEPALAGHYQQALHFADEAHLEPSQALPRLLNLVKASGAKIKLGIDLPANVSNRENGWLIDCRGLDAKSKLKNLRGVRGERLVIHTNEIKLNRAIHLLHPRFPIYIVPWSNGHFMIGATVVETETTSPVTVRSALELLSSAYALHPAFAEAEIVSFDVGIRPAFPDNLPKIVINGRTLYINGLYRNGFLLAPILAEQTRKYVETGRAGQEIFVEDYFER